MTNPISRRSFFGLAALVPASVALPSSVEGNKPASFKAAPGERVMVTINVSQGVSKDQFLMSRAEMQRAMR